MNPHYNFPSSQHLDLSEIEGEHMTTAQVRETWMAGTLLLGIIAIVIVLAVALS